MDSRFNIPAPAVVKRIRDISPEMGRRLKVAVPQGDVAASAKADPSMEASRKADMCSHGRPYRKPTQVGE
jgi:hypothetical protein